MIDLAVVWHWWIGFFFSFAAIGLVILTVIGYINKVVRPQYPKKS